MSVSLCVVHLVWAPLGPQPLEHFLDAYGKREAGAAHDLALILNGFSSLDDGRLMPIERALEGVDHQRIVTPSSMRDLNAYRFAAEQIPAHELCFLNSYSEPMVDGWLALLAKPHAEPSVGLTGSGGSYESAYTSAPFFLRPLRRDAFSQFPNPHLRSNGFMLSRELLLDLDWPLLRSKADAWALESGKRSISRQVWQRGLQVLVVGRDGIAYPPERWRESATFRTGGQRNVLIADNRTRQYEQAKGRRRRALEQMAWGTPDLGTMSSPAIPNRGTMGRGQPPSSA